jgi:thymidylate kinase
MLLLYQRLFQELNQEIPYAAWKGCHELYIALEGKANVDILIDPDYQDRFQRLMCEYGFVHAEYKQLSFPLVEHYYCYDKMLDQIGHLHVYYGLVTGESHTKSYHIPLEKEFLSRRFMNDYGIYELSYCDQAVVHAIRHYMKISSLLGYLFWARERPDYVQEYDYISNGLISQAGGATSRVASIDLLTFNFGQLPMTVSISAYLDARRRISQLAHYRRLGTFEALFQSLYNFAVRVLIKIFRVGKRLDKGIVFAISGVDGSGKSSLVKDLSKWLQDDFDVVTVHLGRPTPTMLTLLLYPFLFFYHLIQDRKAASLAIPTERTRINRVPRHTIMFATRQLALAYERYQLARHARQRADSGWIVISDRYPSNSDGKMDSPKLKVGTFKPLNQFAKAERALYGYMPNADVVIWLDVTPETAIERNQQRVKRGKETDAEIFYRHKNNQQLDFRTKQTVIVDANHDYDTVLRNVKRILWELLNER